MEVRKSIAVRAADSTRPAEAKSTTTITAVTIGSGERDKTQAVPAGLFPPDSQLQR